MFNATYISASEGVGKESGNPWYKVELIAETITGKQKVLVEFCTENAYRSAMALESMQKCKVASGVTDSGHVSIHALKGVE